MLFPVLAHADMDRSLLERITRRQITLPRGAERWMLVPRWDKIAPTYNAAVERVLVLIKQTRHGKFYNYRAGNLGPSRLRQHERSIAMWEKLCDAQSGHDILIVPVQAGFFHRAGPSAGRAR